MQIYLRCLKKKCPVIVYDDYLNSAHTTVYQRNYTTQISYKNGHYEIIYSDKYFGDFIILTYKDEVEALNKKHEFIDYLK